MLNLSQRLQKISHIIGRNILSESFLPFRLIYKLVRKVNFKWTVNRNGNRFKILIKDGMGIMNFVSDYEPWLDEILPKLLDKKDAVFLDIGANTGQTMIKILPQFPEVRYFGVEPNEYCVRYLQALSEVNKFKSVKILPYAVSDMTGEIELLTRYQDDILATTTHSFRKFTKYAIKKQVRMISGDALIEQENITELSLIKMDIEGGESMAIQGLLNTIKKFQPYIICEIAPLPTEDKDVTVFRTIAANNILSHMRDLNYSVLNIVTGNSINQV
ncbi:MAG: hypothetical protein B7X86_12660 [Sphingobacteriales bacterium 17-39-43]|nr:MAG: hypothetical protein B7Y24_12600 [Sphingobacteriales bacterium 16-39-50]OZA23399.1 MAG: hypothetical protein B7X86_12660 [Sphingobacteriales bacterium 17-39-43]